ncbi:hypothetical protein SLEP1_g29882 [Rubroshorea leprosula]|uniref:Uncharacterized protein n=1 Tax=Rubroshorea leprosula TaxID=152421 RepID=A0AAV5K6H9_9ROSI|nr:hypothetical protein SLEP1_g29882 [Rubroshorea leprosula]
MASPDTIAFLSVLLLFHPTTTLSDFLSPISSSFFDEVCKEVECGKGKCKQSQNGTFYECECDPGWKRTLANDDHDDDVNKFLPCVIPNCTLNHACSAAPAPVQDKATRVNTSIFDPCHWTDCGKGSCNKTSTFAYECVCPEGFFNLLNFSIFPCFQECSIGLDCANLGISMSNKSIAPDPAGADNSNNRAGLHLLRDYNWLIILLASLVMVY